MTPTLETMHEPIFRKETPPQPQHLARSFDMHGRLSQANHDTRFTVFTRHRLSSERTSRACALLLLKDEKIESKHSFGFQKKKRKFVKVEAGCASLFHPTGRAQAAHAVLFALSLVKSTQMSSVVTYATARAKTVRRTKQDKEDGCKT